eukprot:6175863-Pleurochrysis_carterae.AAC.1
MSGHLIVSKSEHARACKKEKGQNGARSHALVNVCTCSERRVHFSPTLTPSSLLREEVEHVQRVYARAACARRRERCMSL